MKKNDKSTLHKKEDSDNYIEGHENQNISDFNPSQYVEEKDEKIRKKEKNKLDNKKSDEVI